MNSTAVLIVLAIAVILLIWLSRDRLTGTFKSSSKGGGASSASSGKKAENSAAAAEMRRIATEINTWGRVTRAQ